MLAMYAYEGQWEAKGVMGGTRVNGRQKRQWEIKGIMGGKRDNGRSNGRQKGQ